MIPQSKYQNKKTYFDGILFDSKKEAQRWGELRLMEKAGLIKDLRRQCKFELIPPYNGERAVHYIADFVYVDLESKKTIVEDAKGARTKEFIIKRKLMNYLLHIKVKEV